MTFDLYIGIDYSGAETPTSGLSGLQVYSSSKGEDPKRVYSPHSTKKAFRNWTRKYIYQWLAEQLQQDKTFIAGLDHGFSFPNSYFERTPINCWDEFLEDFCHHWPTDGDKTTVDSIRDGNPKRTGTPDEFRLTEKWTSSAKSVFLFDVTGSVAKSTHTGIPWLKRIRDEFGRKVHFYPFDGWEVPKGKSVFAEVYPSIWKNRYERGKRTSDQQDAYAIARWLSESDRIGILADYFHPPLTEEERKIADREGWILGVC